MFYFVLPIEIGLIGAIGAIGMSTFPIKYLVQSKSKRHFLESLNNLSVLIRITLPIYLAILFILLESFQYSGLVPLINYLFFVGPTLRLYFILGSSVMKLRYYHKMLGLIDMF